MRFAYPHIGGANVQFFELFTPIGVRGFKLIKRHIDLADEGIVLDFWMTAGPEEHKNSALLGESERVTGRAQRR